MTLVSQDKGSGRVQWCRPGFESCSTLLPGHPGQVPLASPNQKGDNSTKSMGTLKSSQEPPNLSKRR